MHRKKQIIFEWVQVVLGLFIFSFGVHCTIRANIGLAPWDCFGMGLSYHTPMSYGIAMSTIGLIILLFDILLKEHVGYGTVMDALLTGNAVEWFNQHSPFPEIKSALAGVMVMCIGLAVMAVGQYIYMRAAQCCGPRDSLLVGLGKQVKKIPIGIVQILIYAVVLFIGWLLGGSIGIGTIICVFGGGVIMQFVFNMLHFEPRNIVHKDIITTTKLLIHKE